MIRISLRLMLVSFITALLISERGFSQHSGNPELGKQKSLICVTCHGKNGVSPSNDFPHLSGQISGYIALQLSQFKSGERDDPIMGSMVANLSDKDMKDIDAYYASQNPNHGSIQNDIFAGKQIYRTGYDPYHIPPCMSCHGPTGHGIPPHFPRIAGQNTKYLESQLMSFKSRKRKHFMMNSIAFPMSEEQIKEVSLYMSSMN